MKKTVLITGASRGIGRATAIYFAQNNYNIIATCHNREDLMTSLEEEITQCGVSFKYYVCDHSDFNSAKQLISDIVSNNQSVDVLVNNAGISVVGLHQDLTNEEWTNLWNSNVTSVIALTKEIIPVMLTKHNGKIINISSVWGNVGASYECAYSATKGAVNSFTKALAKELAPSNIQVNAISCGIIDTDMNSHLSAEDLSAICEEIPAGRIGSPQDIARAVFALAESGSYLTGQIITVDGGWT
ncbi:MAG: SDR family NAD(P)-dependent oxidoreductase [Lachnospiraceae bacterium]|nr:SDR family NAD(P)-dependent oxidoreductase [Lachnospiraceae bacterium]